MTWLIFSADTVRDSFECTICKAVMSLLDDYLKENRTSVGTSFNNIMAIY